MQIVCIKNHQVVPLKLVPINEFVELMTHKMMDGFESTCNEMLNSTFDSRKSDEC